MKPRTIGKKFCDWLKLPLGQSLVQEEAKNIEPLIKTIFGFHLVFLGEAPLLQCISKSPIRNCVWIHPDATQREDCSSIISRQDKLPIMADEIDLIHLAHCLEFNTNPHEVLREAYAALKPEGYLILTGFNPWSLWGVWKIVFRYLKKMSWDAEFISLGRLKDWLALLGFDMLQVKTCFFRPPLERTSWLEKFSWCEKPGKFLLPFCGASYIILAQKRVVTLTLIKPQWVKRQAVPTHRWVEPVTKV